MGPELDTLVRVASPALLAVCVWFLKRAVKDIDKATSTVEAHTVAIALLEASRANLERDVAALRLQVQDLGGFLRDQGFRKRHDNTD